MWIFVPFLLAVILANATGDEDLQRLVAYGVVGSAVLVLVVYAVVAPDLYREVWRIVRTGDLAALTRGRTDREVRPPPSTSSYPPFIA